MRQELQDVENNVDNNTEPIEAYMKWANSFWDSPAWEDWRLREGQDEPKSVLIVDDDATTVRLFKTMLKIADETVRIKSFASAEEAEKYLNHLRVNGLSGPDIALIDYQLRAKDGLYVCELLEYYFPQTKVVMVSGMNPVEICKEMEVHNLKIEFIPKPVAREQISHILRT